MCGRTSRVWGTQRTPTRTSDSRKSKATGLMIALSEPGTFIMEQKMLRTIRDRVESARSIRPTLADTG